MGRWKIEKERARRVKRGTVREEGKVTKWQALALPL